MTYQVPIWQQKWGYSIITNHIYCCIDTPFLNNMTVRMTVISTVISYNSSPTWHDRLIGAEKVFMFLQGLSGPGSECTTRKYILILVCSFVLPLDVVRQVMACIEEFWAILNCTVLFLALMTFHMPFKSIFV